MVASKQRRAGEGRYIHTLFAAGRGPCPMPMSISSISSISSASSHQQHQLSISIVIMVRMSSAILLV